MLAARMLSSTGPSSMLGPLLMSFSRAMKSWDETTQPATQSLVPLMNFVMLCTTTSAPRRSGDRMSGLNVLSTTSRRRARVQAGQSGMSATSSSGLLMLSQYRTRVFGVIAALTVCSSPRSTNRVVIPNRGSKLASNA